MRFGIPPLAHLRAVQPRIVLVGEGRPSTTSFVPLNEVVDARPLAVTGYIGYELEIWNKAEAISTMLEIAKHLAH